MAYHFHDLSPYVLIGNPLTLTIIEFFAVPGALLGAALYPLGLDAPVWLYVGAGIRFILWVARFIASAPGSTLHLRAFAPYALPFLSLAVLSATIWRTWTFRAMAIPFAFLGVVGAMSGSRYDVLIAPSGEQAAVRDPDGDLAIVAKRFNAFAAEQWLTADGDAREPKDAHDLSAPCDRLGCLAELPEGRALSLVLDPLAFDEDCARAAIVVSAVDGAGRLQGGGFRRAAPRHDRRRRDHLGRRAVRGCPTARPRGPAVVAAAQSAARRPPRAAGQGRRDAGRSRRSGPRAAVKKKALQGAPRSFKRPLKRNRRQRST